jgi:FAD/FMN-containing dehydrogenase
MPRASWNTRHISECERLTGQKLLSDEPSLVTYSGDFGGLRHSRPAAVFSPPTTQALQQVLAYANKNGLPVTLRAHGLSQCGQTLPVAGGLTLHMDRFRTVHEQDDAVVWADANANWSDLLAATLPNRRVPYVTPYNANLSIAGLLSVGGVGAASFRHGVAAAHVDALEVVTADGEVQRVDGASPLLQACLAGLGSFGVITKAAIRLRPCGRQVRTFSLAYLDKEQWLKDLTVLKGRADFIETVCSPSVQGTRLTPKGRQPFAEWLFALHASFEYDDEAPELAGLDLAPWKVTHRQDEPMDSYVLRHNSRFDAMKLTGQWELQHPWYECLVPQHVLLDALDDLLDTLPLYYATVVHLVPIAKRQPAGLFMAPDEPEFFSIMILTPGVPPALVPGCLATVAALDARFLARGGKRYLAGYLGSDLPPDYWKAHYGAAYRTWLDLKARYDPKGIFCSALRHHNAP